MTGPLTDGLQLLAVTVRARLEYERWAGRTEVFGLMTVTLCVMAFIAAWDHRPEPRLAMAATLSAVMWAVCARQLRKADQRLKATRP